MKKNNIDISGLVIKTIKILFQGCLIFFVIWFFVFLLAWFMNAFGI